MCDVCGCEKPRLVVEVHSSLLHRNDTTAGHLRSHFEAAGLTTLNLMGSPGAGKTALLEATARALSQPGAPGHAAGASAQRPLRLAAVSGDLATENDADRLKRAGIPSLAITTGTGCHLDAAMVHDALHHPTLAAALVGADFFFVENVGNLVCPALFDLGQTANVVVLSVTEGVDKPEKYPVMFRHADLVLVTKMDLLPHLPDVSVAAIEASLARVRPNARVLPVSARTGEGMSAFIDWLLGLRGRPSHTSVPL